MSIEPVRTYEKAGSHERRERGKTLIAQGKMGCLILAGGQGSRLKMGGPKGLTPVSLIKQKSLFQIFFEKALAASKRAGRALPLAVMTSPLNHEETKSFLEEHAYFGVAPDSVSLFSQGMMPLLDDQHQPLPVEAPDGNGEALKHFVEAGIWETWHGQGIEALNVVLIDNPLADPFDAELLATHMQAGNDVTLKAILRQNAEEKVGVIVQCGKHLKVIEYSELSEEQKDLRFSLANISLFCFSMDFVRKSASIKLPLHLARKTAAMGHVWKRETFIFDLLEHTQRAGVLVYDRKDCFSPLKNATGDASIDTVHAALLDSDRRTYENITGIPVSNQTFELDMAFYYPTEELLRKWKGRPLPSTPYVKSDIRY